MAEVMAEVMAAAGVACLYRNLRKPGGHSRLIYLGNKAPRAFILQYREGIHKKIR